MLRALRQLTGLFLLGLLACRAGDADCSPADASCNIYAALVYAPGVAFVAASATGGVFYSYDGAYWYPAKVAVPGVVYAGGARGSDRFVLTGDSGRLFYSFDGINWSASVGPGGANALISAGFANGVYFAGDSIQFTWRSPGLENPQWTSVNIGAPMHSFAYDGQGTVIGGDGGCNGHRSVDFGASWPSAGVSCSVLYGAYAEPGHFAFVGSGEAHHSTDAAGWTQTYTGANVWRAVAYGGGVLVAVGNQLVMRSTDRGLSWQSEQSAFAGGVALSIAYNGNRFVAVNTLGQVYISTDAGSNWRLAATPSSSALNIVVAAN